MATLSDLAGATSGLPGATGEDATFSLGKKPLCWPYLRRTTRNGTRESVAGVIAVRCDLPMKELLIEAAPDRYFDDDHYRGYPAVLIRLEAIAPTELSDRLRDAWRIQASVKMRKAAESRQGQVC